MDEKTKNILSLNHKEAMDFFLKSEQYHGFELPEYFVFDELLQNVKEAVGDKPYEECLQEGLSPENLSGVNLDILLNKDGRYAVRPIILANPFLYCFLVREICNEKSWTLITKLLRDSWFRILHHVLYLLFQRIGNHFINLPPFLIGGVLWNNGVLNYLSNTVICLLQT